MTIYKTTRLFTSGLLKDIKIIVDLPFEVKKGFKCNNAIGGSSYIVRKVQRMDS
jgi:hypothetical protein